MARLPTCDGVMENSYIQCICMIFSVFDCILSLKPNKTCIPLSFQLHPLYFPSKLRILFFSLISTNNSPSPILGFHEVAEKEKGKGTEK